MSVRRGPWKKPAPVSPARHHGDGKVSRCFEDRRVGDKWRCDACGKVDSWGPTWGWYGPLSEDECLWMSCSAPCAKVLGEEMRK